MEADMFSRFHVALIVTALLALVTSIPVFAGGWAVITLDTLPSGVAAGVPVTIGFTVLQHGKTPLADLYPTVTAQLSDSKSFVVKAEAQGKPGHYTATLIFPEEGNWSWSIQAFTMDQAMPELSVAAASQPVANEKQKTASVSPLLVVRILALVIGLAGLFVAYRRKSRFAVGLIFLCLLIAAGSFAAGSSLPAGVEAQSRSSVDASISQVEMGRRLFIAKGCITCHVNTKVEKISTHWTIDMGAPDLSNFSADPGYLDKWLFNPAAIKPATYMPDLHLSDSERAALIAFINSK
jgi:cytochrome c2